MTTAGLGNTFLDNLGVIILSVTVLLVLWVLGRKWSNLNRKTIPGLPRIPIVGSLPWLPCNITYLTLNKFARKYGKIYSIDLGQQRAVVLNDYGSIHEALVKQAVTFAERPSNSSRGKRKSEKTNFLVGNFDENFIRKKQVCLAVLRDLGVGRNLIEKNILREIDELLKAFDKQKGTPFYPESLIYISVSNMICSILFNKRFEYDDIRFSHALKHLHEMIKQYGEKLNVVEFLPLARFLPMVKRRMKAFGRTYMSVMRFIKEELQTHSIGSNRSDYQNDFIAGYTQKMGDSLDKDELKNIALAFLAAGTDTTATKLSWILIYMANNPNVQSRVHRELDGVIGKCRSPSMSDRISLKYVEAVILETLRKSPISATITPRGVTTDTELQGYLLKKGTLVYINTGYAHNDSAMWPDPNKFDPGRFLDDQGQVVGREKILSFGLGRRSCMGEALARQELFLYFTSILQRFQVLPPPNQDRLSEEGEVGDGVSPEPYQVVLKPRY